MAAAFNTATFEVAATVVMAAAMEVTPRVMEVTPGVMEVTATMEAAVHCPPLA